MAANALTIDVEDWFHPELVRDHLHSTSPAKRVNESIRPILALLDRYGEAFSFSRMDEVLKNYPS
jgi:hypothetical protein